MKKNMLILGGFGFIGSNIIEELLKTNLYNIIVFEFKGVTHKLADCVTVCYGDFNNETDLAEVFKNHKIDVVVHLISTTVPATSNENITYDINSNLIGTIRLLDMMLLYGINKIVFFSSGGTVYGDFIEIRAHENQQTNPISSHGIIKLCIEKYLLLYNRLYNLEYLILRASNPYGEYHKSDKQGFINVTIKRILQNEKIVIWGDGTIVRDFIYVKDLGKIVGLLLKKNIFNDIINIGTGEGHSVNQVLEYIAEYQPHFEIQYEASRKYDVQKIILDIDKLNSIEKIDFTCLKEGICRTYQWYKKQLLM